MNLQGKTKPNPQIRATAAAAITRSGDAGSPGSEVALLLAVLHGGVADLVVAAGGAALGQAGHRDLRDDLLDGRGPGPDRGGQVGVAARPVADGLAPHLLALAGPDG